MRNLGRSLLRLLGKDDRGAIGVMVAVLIGGGVLLGMAALVVDVGQIYQNRAELQNGADAGALAVARQCGLNNCTNTMTTAVGYANSNASALTGHTDGVTIVCGHDNQDPGALNPCPTTIESTALTACPQDPTNGASFVDVLTSTKLPSGSTLLPPVFAETLVGGATYNGTTVQACAQAQWGGAEQSNSLALTISECAWQQLANGGNPPFKQLVAVFVKGKDKNCTDTAGQDVPGGFGWLNTTNGTCTAVIDLTTDTTVSNPGASPPNGNCDTVLQTDTQDYLNGNPVTVFIPIFECPPGVIDCTGNGQGSGAKYQIIGLAGFVITGYANVQQVQGSGGQKSLGTNSLCTAPGPGGNQPCIEGYFIPGLDPVSDYISSTPGPFNVSGIKLSG